MAATINQVNAWSLLAKGNVPKMMTVVEALPTSVNVNGWAYVGGQRRGIVAVISDDNRLPAMNLLTSSSSSPTTTTSKTGDGRAATERRKTEGKDEENTNKSDVDVGDMKNGASRSSIDAEEGGDQHKETVEEEKVKSEATSPLEALRSPHDNSDNHKPTTVSFSSLGIGVTNAFAAPLLMYAIALGEVEAVRFLLRMGSSPSISLRGGVTPLAMARHFALPRRSRVEGDGAKENVKKEYFLTIGGEYEKEKSMGPIAGEEAAKEILKLVERYLQREQNPLLTLAEDEEDARLYTIEAEERRQRAIIEKKLEGGLVQFICEIRDDVGGYALPSSSSFDQKGKEGPRNLLAELLAEREEEDIARGRGVVGDEDDEDNLLDEGYYVTDETSMGREVVSFLFPRFGSFKALRDRLEGICGCRASIAFDNTSFERLSALHSEIVNEGGVALRPIGGGTTKNTISSSGSMSVGRRTPTMMGGTSSASFSSVITGPSATKAALGGRSGINNNNNNNSNNNNNNNTSTATATDTSQFIRGLSPMPSAATAGIGGNTTAAGNKKGRSGSSSTLIKSANNSLVLRGGGPASTLGIHNKQLSSSNLLERRIAATFSTATGATVKTSVGIIRASSIKDKWRAVLTELSNGNFLAFMRQADLLVELGDKLKAAKELERGSDGGGQQRSVAHDDNDDNDEVVEADEEERIDLMFVPPLCCIVRPIPYFAASSETDASGHLSSSTRNKTRIFKELKAYEQLPQQERSLAKAQELKRLVDEEEREFLTKHNFVQYQASKKLSPEALDATMKRLYSYPVERIRERYEAFDGDVEEQMEKLIRTRRAGELPPELQESVDRLYGGAADREERLLQKDEEYWATVPQPPAECELEEEEVLAIRERLTTDTREVTRKRLEDKYYGEMRERWGKRLGKEELQQSVKSCYDKQIEERSKEMAKLEAKYGDWQQRKRQFKATPVRKYGK